MNFIFVLLIFLNNFNSVETNPYIGTWRHHTIKSFNETYKIKPGEFSSFESSITFHENMTFEKITNGKKTIGKYEFTPNKFKYFELNSKGEYECSWGIRWPKKTTDPSPLTLEKFDLNYPELFNVKDKNNKDIKVDLDVYYLKQ